MMWKKHCRAGQAIEENVSHANCMVNIKGYKHTYICNT